ncbi:MAG: ATP-binding protein [Planctomycetota bacterium]
MRATFRRRSPRRWLAAAWVGDESFCSDLLAADDATRFPFFVLATPVRDLQGQRVIGRLLAWVHPGVWVARSLEQTRAATREPDLSVALSLHDQKGKRLRVPPFLMADVRPRPDSEVVASGFGLQLDDLPDGRVAWFTPSQGLLAQRLELSGNRWSVHVQVRSEKALEPIALLQSRFLVVGAVLAAIAGVLLYFPMRFLARPLVELRNASLRIKEGDYRARVAVDSTDEIGELASAFNAMALALAERTAHLEHALRDNESHGRELQAERDRLDGVIHSMRDGLVVLDGQGQVILHNAAARPLLAMIGSDMVRATGRHVCRERPLTECRACLFDPHGPQRSCVLDVGDQVLEVHTTTLTPDQNGRIGRVLVARDVTDRIVQDEYQIHQERLAVLGEVAAVMAHELNNPLAAISMFNQLLRDALSEGSPLRENVDLIQRNTETCRRTIRELLDYATGASPEVQAVNLHDTLADVVRFLRPLSRRANAEIAWQLGAGDPEITGDEIHIRQIFVNLVMNALQAIGGKGGSVTLATAIDGNHLVVDVIDDGPGIADEARARLFRPFFTTKPRGEGTGLGLSTARRIAEMHGGSLELVESRPGRTVFRVRLRRRPAAASDQRSILTVEHTG